MASCVQSDDGQPPAASVTVEGYIGGAWVELYSGSLTLPSVPTNLGETFTQAISLSPTFTAALTCELRVTLSFFCLLYTSDAADE